MEQIFDDESNQTEVHFKKMIKRKMKRSPPKINKAIYGYGFDDKLEKAISMSPPRTSLREKREAVQPQRPTQVPSLGTAFELQQLGKTAITKPKPVDINLKTRLDKSPRPNFNDELIRIS